MSAKVHVVGRFPVSGSFLKLRVLHRTSAAKWISAGIVAQYLLLINWERINRHDVLCPTPDADSEMISFRGHSESHQFAMD